MRQYKIKYKLFYPLVCSNGATIHQYCIRIYSVCVCKWLIICPLPLKYYCFSLVSLEVMYAFPLSVKKVFPNGFIGKSINECSWKEKSKVNLLVKSGFPYSI